MGEERGGREEREGPKQSKTDRDFENERERKKDMERQRERNRKKYMFDVTPQHIITLPLLLLSFSFLPNRNYKRSVEKALVNMQTFHLCFSVRYNEQSTKGLQRQRQKQRQRTKQ